MGLKKYGKGDWRNISRNFVTTRTPTQVASHAQKYFIRQLTGGKDKRRSSIHDITTVNVPDIKSPSPESNRPLSDSSTTGLQPQQQAKLAGVDKELYEWKVPMEETAITTNMPNKNAFISPLYAVSSYGPKLEEQSLIGGGLLGSSLGPYYTGFGM